MEFNIFVAQKEHAAYVDIILDTIAEAAKVRGTGIARRSPDYILKKIEEGKAILALYNGEFAGFCYIETWGHEKFVANSGLIVVDEYRGKGLAKAIKSKAFDLSRSRYPQAKLFGLTTGLAVMKINSDLGYRPVTFSELTDDEMFWKGCQTCVNYDILLRTERKHCLCTGMLFDPEKMKSSMNEKQKSKSIKSRWQTVRESVMHLKKNKNNNKDNVLSKFKRAMALL